MLNELVRSLVVPPSAFGDGGEILGRTDDGEMELSTFTESEGSFVASV